MDTKNQKVKSNTSKKTSKSVQKSTTSKTSSKNKNTKTTKSMVKRTQKAGSLPTNGSVNEVYKNFELNENGSIIADGSVNVTISRIEPVNKTCSPPKNVGVKRNTDDELNDIFYESFNINLDKFPSYTPSASLNTIVPKENFDLEKQYSLLNLFKPKTIFGQSLASNNFPYKVKVTLVKGNELLKRLSNYNLPDEIKMCKEMFDMGTENDELVVKITDVTRWRNLMKCYKEAKIHKELYDSVGTDENGNMIYGRDLVVKPYACCPIFYNNKWRMVFVQGYASGDPVFKFIKNDRDREKIYSELIPKLMEACNKLWCLGYVHGDLHSRNAHYDFVTKKVTIIDLESTMKIPTVKVDEYKQARILANEKLKSITNKQERAGVYLKPFQDVLQGVAQQTMHKVKGWIETLEDCSNSTVVNETSDIFYA